MNPPSGANGLAAPTAVGLHAHRTLSLRAEAVPVVTSAEGRSLPSLTNAGHRVVEGTRLSTTLPFQANLCSPTSASPLHQSVALALRTHALGSAPSAALHPPHSPIGPARATATLLARPKRPADEKAFRALKRRLLASGPSMTAEAALRAADAAELVKIAVWWQQQSGWAAAGLWRPPPNYLHACGGPRALRVSPTQSDHRTSAPCEAPQAGRRQTQGRAGYLSI